MPDSGAEQDPDVTEQPPAESEPSVNDVLADLVSAAREGEPGAFDELVRRTYQDTYTLAMRLTGNEEDARDVVQESYLRAFRGLKRFRGESSFSTWMYRITANCASTQLVRRGRHRHDELPEDVSDTGWGDFDPQLQTDASDLRARLLVALDELPPKLRSVVVLRDIYEMPHDAIAAELGISVTAAKVRLHRARHRLRASVFPELDEVESRAV